MLQTSAARREANDKETRDAATKMSAKKQIGEDVTQFRRRAIRTKKRQREIGGRGGLARNGGSGITKVGGCRRKEASPLNRERARL